MRHLRVWLVTTPRGPRVTVRLHYGRPPFGGQQAQDERVQTTRAHGLGNGTCPGVRSTVRGQKLPRWSAERRTSRVMGREGARSRPAGLRHWPANGCLASTHSACRRSAPSHVCEGNWQTSEEQLPRENDDACSIYLRHPEVAALARPSKDDGHRPGRASFEARLWRAPQDDGERFCDDALAQLFIDPSLV